MKNKKIAIVAADNPEAVQAEKDLKARYNHVDPSEGVRSAS